MAKRGTTIALTSSRGTSTAILDIAERLAQTRGFNGFSYADIAKELGITKATIHHHYASKAILGERLIERYTINFLSALQDIDSRQTSCSEKLNAYVKLYVDVLEAERMCLCGMLAAEVDTLPAPMPGLLQAFFERNTEWVASLLAAGIQAGEFALNDTSNGAASAIVSGLEGAMLLAKVRGGVVAFRASSKILIAAICRAADG